MKENTNKDQCFTSREAVKRREKRIRVVANSCEFSAR